MPYSSEFVRKLVEIEIKYDDNVDLVLIRCFCASNCNSMERVIAKLNKLRRELSTAYRAGGTRSQ